MSKLISKSKPVLVLSPESELHFNPDHKNNTNRNEFVSQLKLTNPTQRRVVFQMKTAFKTPTYQVIKELSKLDLIESHQSRVIEIRIPSEKTLQLKGKNTYDFIIESMFAPEGKLDLKKFWNEVNFIPDAIMESKLKYVIDK